MKAKTLLILRHGKSDWGTGDEDFDRPLVERGRVGSVKMGTWIKSRKLVPDVLLSSPAARARGTTQAACRAMGLPLKTVRWDERLYAASLEDLLTVLAACPASARRVLVVGHNPGLEELIDYLAGGAIEIPADGKLLPTSALAQLEIAADWAKLEENCATLISVTRPGQVPDALADDPPDDEDRGPVPAYFFTQSAVLPYRWVDGKLQFLVIASRKGTRWVIPKGVKEPELSLRDSAAKEALEEAGVRGRIDEQPIGEYDYKKWGGVCNVVVFPMEVSDSIPEEDWEESHRERRWLGIDDTRQMLDERALRKLVDKLEKRLGKRGS